MNIVVVLPSLYAMVTPIMRQFENEDIRKNIYGDKRSDASRRKAKINMGADGDIFELIENAQYNGSRAESGKSISAHKNVSYWDYFVKRVQIDHRIYDLVANVRKRSDGEFVYSIQFKESKKTTASPSKARQNAALKSHGAQRCCRQYYTTK